nr:alpha-amylase family glycosyl hydrolase [Fontibacillus panacisegetis]
MKKASPLSQHSLKWFGSATLAITLLLSGCTSGPNSQNVNNSNETTPENVASLSINENASKTNATNNSSLDTQPSSGVFYEIFVRSFYDSDGDGIGDFKGLTQKLDYLNDGNPNTTEDLGIGGIWLMPINPSPSYHGYDVTDYRSINPEYGTMDDFKKFLDEAHKRGIKVVMDLVVNHSSSEHPWFIEASENKDSKYRDYYTWAEDQNITVGGSSAAGSGNPWHVLNGSHYLGTFSPVMPDMNFDNPKVRDEFKDIGRYWLDLGLDGFRLDAAKHIYENLFTDKSQETTDKNVAWWQEFRKALHETHPDAYLVGEIWDNSATTIASYVNEAMDSGFNFGLSSIMIQSAKSETDSKPGFTLERTYTLYSKTSNGNFVDAPFLTNHDLVRIMTQLDGDTNHAKMAASLLLTLPGNPFIYYGDEIGMLGAKPDESIREPMQWYKGGSGEGQTTWELTTYNTGQPGSSVEEQTIDPDSLLSHYRMIISFRNTVPALKDGDIRNYSSGVKGVTTFVRLTEVQKVLVVHNLTGSEQIVELTDEPEKYSFKDILKTTNKEAKLEGSKLTIPAYSTTILE